MLASSIKETSVFIAFATLPDPRKLRNQTYSLFELVTVSVLGVLCGADDWVEISIWAEANHEWLQQNGICGDQVPSHDTLSRFFRFVDPLAFEACFIRWTQQIAQALGGIIALDGKTLCNSADSTTETRAIHIVSAFSVDNQLVLGQLATEKKSNEITAFPLLLKMLDIKGATITIDAGGCHKPLAKQIREQGGDYVFGLKGNQPTLLAEVDNFFVQAMEIPPDNSGCEVFETEERSRDRIEKREVWVTDNLEWLPQLDDWTDLRSVICVRSTRTIQGKTTVEFRNYISSLPADAKRLARAIRAHWGIENQLHWQLDVAYGEDGCTVRKDHGAENFSILRRSTLNMLKADKVTKAGIKNRRSKAGWDRKYLLEIVGVK